jgi:osmotically inducible protein OsmC
MALSLELSKEGLTPNQIQTQAHLTFENVQTGWTVTGIHLDVSASVPGASSAQFQKAAESAKANCPISRLLNTKITMEAKLE